MLPKYTFDKIKYATDPPTLKKAIDLYNSSKIIDFEDNGLTYTAKVKGTTLYNVIANSKQHAIGSCDCYLGQNDTLCKHLVAVTIYAILRGKKLKKEDLMVITSPKCSNIKGELSKDELENIKKEISNAIKYIKAYTGPSKTWFSYQNNLLEGVNRLSTIISSIPVSFQTSEILTKLMIRIDKKLVTGGVDDSDGTVGTFIQEMVNVLHDYAKLDITCIDSFRLLIGVSTCFEWEDSLIELYENNHNLNFKNQQKNKIT